LVCVDERRQTISSAADLDALVEDLVATIRHPDLWRRRCQVDKGLSRSPRPRHAAYRKTTVTRQIIKTAGDLRIHRPENQTGNLALSSTTIRRFDRISVGPAQSSTVRCDAGSEPVNTAAGASPGGFQRVGVAGRAEIALGPVRRPPAHGTSAACAKQVRRGDSDPAHPSGCRRARVGRRALGLTTPSSLAALVSARACSMTKSWMVPR
jgi:hypothetical protein